MTNPLRLTLIGREHPDLLKQIEDPETTIVRVRGAGLEHLDVPVPGLIEASGYSGVFSGAEEMERPVVVAGILARQAPRGAPWSVDPARRRETLYDLGARALEAAHASGAYPGDVISAGYRLFNRLTVVMAPSEEAVEAAEGFSQAPAGTGSSSEANSSSGGNTSSGGST